ncbi:MAG: family transcriptional regulator [Lachnospiraceae bacterium]|jgi:transcriptional regulator with XRE-family HTH domain|nr:family transcriptional regulator [Lachnospiraceae bacterium]
MSFGTNLIKIRKSLNISQSKLGKDLGITQQMISSYEKGISSPNVELLTKLADYFQISIDYLVDHTVHGKEHELQKTQLIQLFDNISADDRTRCLLILNTFVIDSSKPH